MGLFLDVISALKDLWFDIFTVNQYQTAVRDYTWWSTTVRDCIKSIGYALLVLAPWNNPLPLRRAWCEIYSAITAECAFEIAMSNKETVALINSLTTSGREELDALIAVVDVEKSEPFKPEDKANIFKTIRETHGGFSVVNKAVFDALRNWQAALADTMSRNSVDADIINATTSLDVSFGKYAEAELLYVKCWDVSAATLGEDGPITLTTMNNLASQFESQGKYAEAELLNVKCLEIQKVKLGEDHPDTLATINNLAGLYKSEGRCSDAESLYLKSLEVQRMKLGGDHPSTLTGLFNLG